MKSGLETDSTRIWEYIDWEAVDRFVEGVYALATATTAARQRRP
ncbi:MAG: hypothetical protein ACR2JK_02765 [Geodermatophilaceae bacterium]